MSRRTGTFAYRILVIIILASSLALSPARAFAQIARGDRAGLTILESNEDGIIFELKVPTYTLSALTAETGPISEIVVPGSTKSYEQGKPQVPMFSALIGIPADASLELNLLDDKQTEIGSDLNLLAVPRIISPVDDYSEGEDQAPVGSRDAAVAAWYPSEIARIAEVGWLRDQRIARIEFFPFQYRPSDGRVVWHTDMRVKIGYAFDRVGESNSRIAATDEKTERQSPFDAALRQNLVNYDVARTFRSGIPAQEIQSFSQPEWMQAGEPRYRIEVDSDGLYQLTYLALQAAGLDVAHIDPTLLHLTSQGEDVAIYIENEDGNEQLFSPGENIYFYGQKFYGDRLAQRYAAEADNYLPFSSQLPNGTPTMWYPQFNAKMLEKYTDTNVYWLSLESTPGLLMQPVDATPHDTAQVPDSYSETVHEEQSRYWYTFNFTSEETWYWDEVRLTTVRPYTTTLTALATGDISATIRAELVARANNIYNNPDHHIQLRLNAQPTPFHEYWDGISRYRFEESIPQSQLIEGTNTLWLQMFLDAYSGQTGDWLYFDWFEIDFSRRFQAQNDRISFSRSEANTTWQYEISGFSSPAAYVLDITSPLEPRWIINQRLLAGVLAYEGRHTGTGSYLAVGTNSVRDPKSIVYYDPPDLYSTSNSYDYLIITHTDFIASVQQLANFRDAQGLSTLVVDVNDLYNEFNYGIFHSIAIKNFLAYAYAHWADPPSYALLVGDGHWNFKGYQRYYAPTIFMPPHLGWFDPVQGEVDSSNQLAAVVGADPIPDILIGRLPVNSVVEANTAITKIINYGQAPLQGWEDGVTFIADNVPDPAGDFMEASERIIDEYIEPGFNVSRIYENDFGCPGTGCTQVKQTIISRLNTTGTLLLSFTGHGAINRWSQESIFTNADIPSLNNPNQLPVILSMTCLDGYWMHAGQIPNPSSSLIEELLRTPNKGAVSAFSPTGLGVATGHDELWRGFHDATFRDGNWILGEAALAAKLRLYATGGNVDLVHTYTIFGDPALKIKAPYGLSTVILPDGQIHLPGSIVQRTIRVTNNGLVPDTFDITASGNQWVVDVPDTLGPVAAGATVDVLVYIYTPLFAPNGSSDTVHILIASQGDRSLRSEPTLVTTVNIDFTWRIVRLPQILK